MLEPGAEAYASEKGVVLEDAFVAGLSVGEVESAATSARLFAST